MVDSEWLGQLCPKQDCDTAGCKQHIVQPTTAQYSSILPTTGQYSQVELSTAQYNLLHPIAAQYSPAAAQNIPVQPVILVNVVKSVTLSSLSETA